MPLESGRLSAPKSVPRSLPGKAGAQSRDFLVRRTDIYKNDHPSKPTFKSKYHEQLKAERAQKKIEQKMTLDSKIELKNKKMNYGKFVKEEYMPSVSYKKVAELQE